MGGDRRDWLVSVAPISDEKRNDLLRHQEIMTAEKYEGSLGKQTPRAFVVDSVKRHVDEFLVECKRKLNDGRFVTQEDYDKIYEQSRFITFSGLCTFGVELSRHGDEAPYSFRYVLSDNLTIPLLIEAVVSTFQDKDIRNYFGHRDRS